MIQLYFRQAWTLMKQEKLFSAIYILGTGIAVSMVMGLAIVLVALLTNVYPEMNRDRMLIVEKGMVSYPNNNRRYSYLSEQTLHACFDGMKDVEALSIVINGNTQDNIQLPQGSARLKAAMKLVDANFWKVFHFRFLQGKPFSEADFRSGLPVAVISESLARAVFGTTEVVGQELSYAFRNYRICGVVKDVSAISPLSYAQLWTPYTAKEGYKPNDAWEETGALGMYGAFLLVKEGADIRAVKQDGQERIRRFSQTLKEGHALDCMDRPYTFVEQFFSAGFQNSVDFTKVYIAMALLVLCLLFVPAVNLSGMTESRMERRLEELGIRRSFGAPTHVLIKQVVTENLVFTLLGGVVGIGLSFLLVGFAGDWLFKMLLSNFPQGESIFLRPDIFVNFPLFVIALLVCFVLNLLSSFIPAWHASRHPIVDTLRPMVGANLIAGTGMSFFQRMRKNAWIGMELMLVFGLLWAMTDFFLIRVHNQCIPVCRNIDKVWKVKIGILPNGHPDFDTEANQWENRLENYRRMVKGLQQDADVDAVAALYYFGIPYNTGFASWMLRNVRDTTKVATGESIYIDPETDFFRVFGYTTADGKPVSVKDFDWSDPHGVVLGQRTADALFGEGNAVNQLLEDGFDKEENHLRVLGVVGDVKRFDHQRLEHAFYQPVQLTGYDLGDFSIAVRLKPNVSERKSAETFIARIRKTVQYGNFYVQDVKSFQQIKEETDEVLGVSSASSLGITLFFFFLVNIFLCVLGTFWYRIQMRREEIGVRMAMGANKQVIKRMLYKEGLVLLTVVAVPAMFIELQLVLTDVISYGLPEGAQLEYWLDYPILRFAVTNAITWLILAIGIVFAIMLPAARIVRISPADAMREE